jgi:hypothetical protein
MLVSSSLARFGLGDAVDFWRDCEGLAMLCDRGIYNGAVLAWVGSGV